MSMTASHPHAAMMVYEFVTDADVEVLNAELAAKGVDASAIIAILPVSQNVLGAAPGPGERFRVLYRA